MPKQIKKQTISPKEKTSRICSVLTLSTALIMSGFIVFMLPQMIKSESSALTVIFTVGYFLFMISCIVHAFAAYGFFKATGNFTGIFHCILSIVSVFFCVLNLRFIIVMLFSVLDKQNIVKSLIGNQTTTEFINSQTSNWICFVLALLITIIVGVLGIIKLISDKKG